MAAIAKAISTAVRPQLARSATNSRPETGQSAWKNEDHQRGSHVDPVRTLATGSNLESKLER
jgi:hypothetical protein